MKTYKVTVFLGKIQVDDSDEELLKESIKEAMQAAIDLDDSGDDELDFIAEEEEDF